MKFSDIIDFICEISGTWKCRMDMKTILQISASHSVLELIVRDGFPYLSYTERNKVQLIMFGSDGSLLSRYMAYNDVPYVEIGRLSTFICKHMSEYICANVSDPDMLYVNLIFSYLALLAKRFKVSTRIRGFRENWSDDHLFNAFMRPYDMETYGRIERILVKVLLDMFCKNIPIPAKMTYGITEF